MENHMEKNMENGIYRFFGFRYRGYIRIIGIIQGVYVYRVKMEKNMETTI